MLIFSQSRQDILFAFISHFNPSIWMLLNSVFIRKEELFYLLGLLAGIDLLVLVVDHTSSTLLVRLLIESITCQNLRNHGLFVIRFSSLSIHLNFIVTLQCTHHIMTFLVVSQRSLSNCRGDDKLLLDVLIFTQLWDSFRWLKDTARDLVFSPNNMLLVSSCFVIISLNCLAVLEGFTLSLAH